MGSSAMGSPANWTAPSEFYVWDSRSYKQRHGEPGELDCAIGVLRVGFQELQAAPWGARRIGLRHWSFTCGIPGATSSAMGSPANWTAPSEFYVWDSRSYKQRHGEP